MSDGQHKSDVLSWKSTNISLDTRRIIHTLIQDIFSWQCRECIPHLLLETFKVCKCLVSCLLVYIAAKLEFLKLSEELCRSYLFPMEANSPKSLSSLTHLSSICVCVGGAEWRHALHRFILYRPTATDLRKLNLHEVAVSVRDNFVMHCIIAGENGDILDYMSWGQKIYFNVMSRYYREKRPEVNRTMMLGCYNSNHPASHQTPVWWTGDIEYNTLATAVANEVDGGTAMKPYVHPDCTGHHGPDEVGSIPYPPEAYARWVQFCSLGTIFRIHSSSKSKGRQPWLMGEKVENIMRNFTNLRYKLIPMLVEAGQQVCG